MSTTAAHSEVGAALSAVAQWPTRRAEIERVLAAVAAGRSVLVVGFAGDGMITLAQAVATTLGEARAPRLLNASQHTDLRELESFLADPSAPGVIHGADQLPEAAVAAVDAAVNVPGRPMVYVVDGDVLRASRKRPSSVAAVLARAWSGDGMARVDLAPLTYDEILTLVTSAIEPGTLDDLQLHTLAALAGGQPLVATDLAAEASADPHRVPHRYPRPGIDTVTFGSRALLRVSRRYTDLDTELVLAARRLSALSPLHTSTSSRLFGEQVLAQLLSLRLAFEVEEAGETLIAVSPLHGAGLAAICLSEPHDDESYRRSLAALWRAGYPLSEAAVFEIAHRVVKSDLPVDRDEAVLLLKAARISNRLGDPLEAGILRRAAERLADLDPDLLAQARQQQLRTEMLLGRHDLARQTAVRALTEAGENASLDLLYYASVAASWADEPPQWWIDAMRSSAAARHIGAAQVLRAYVGHFEDLDQMVGDLRGVADDPAARPEMRLLALTYLCVTDLNAGNVETLERLITVGLQNATLVTSAQQGPSSDIGLGCAAFFLLVSTGAAALSGIEPTRTENVVRRTLEIATGVARRAGWHVTMCASWMAGLMRSLQGDHQSAGLDYDESQRALRPAHFPIMWTVNVSVSAYLQRVAGREAVSFSPLSAAAMLRSSRSRQLTLGGLVSDATGDDQALLSSALPAWAARMLLAARMTRGSMSPTEAVRVLETLPATTLPAALAQERHLRAAASQVPDEFLAAGRQLAALGFTAMARHAFAHARALFLGRRSAGKAAEAGEGLAALDATVRPKPTSTEQTNVETPQLSAVRLTERELQVCRLISEGLTNVQISKQLVLSVRTVESHVLQSRAKLGAPRRRDIPALLLQYEQSRTTVAPRPSR